MHKCEAKGKQAGGMQACSHVLRTLQVKPRESMVELLRSTFSGLRSKCTMPAGVHAPGVVTFAAS